MVSLSDIYRSVTTALFLTFYMNHRSLSRILFQTFLCNDFLFTFFFFTQSLTKVFCCKLRYFLREDQCAVYILHILLLNPSVCRSQFLQILIPYFGRPFKYSNILHTSAPGIATLSYVYNLEKYSEPPLR